MCDNDLAIRPFNVLALCAGVGGLELGLKLAEPSARCVCYVEGEAYAASVLVSRMADKILDEAPIWSDVRTFDGKPWRGKVGCVTGGYPCQPFSLAGKRLGEADPRHLWPDIRRVIGEVQPEWCFFENVSNHLRMGFEKVHDDLQQMGFRVAAGLFTAEEVGASHKRERLFILSHSKFARGRSEHPQRRRMARDDGVQEGRDQEDVDNPPGPRCQPEGERQSPKSKSGERLLGLGCDGIWEGLPLFPPGPEELDGWREVLKQRPDLEPSVCRIPNGLDNRVDRLRACGNGVVPLVAAYAYRTLKAALA